MPKELWMEVHDIVHETVIKTIPKEKKCKKAKWLSDKGLQTAEKRRKEMMSFTEYVWFRDLRIFKWRP